MLATIDDTEEHRRSADAVRPRNQHVPILLLILATVLWGALARGGFYDRDRMVFVGLSLASASVTIVLIRRTGIARWWLVAAVPSAVAILASAFAGRDLSDAPAALAPIVATVGLGIAGSSAARRVDRLTMLRIVADVAGLLAVLSWIGVAFHLRPFAQSLNDGWRATATIGYANVSGLFLLLGLLCAGVLAAVSGQFSHEVRCWALALGMFATESRSVVLALIVCLGISLFTSRRAATVMARSGSCALVAFAGLLPSVRDTAPDAVLALGTVVLSLLLLATTYRFRANVLSHILIPLVVSTTVGVVSLIVLRSRLFDLGSDRGRIRLWRDALNALHDVGWFGQGPHQVGALSRGTLVVLLLHDDPLQFAQYYGVLGVVALLSASAAVGWALAKTRTAGPPEFWTLGLAVVVATAVVALVDFPLQVPLIPTTVALVFGICIRPGTAPSESPQEIGTKGTGKPCIENMRIMTDEAAGGSGPG